MIAFLIEALASAREDQEVASLAKVLGNTIFRGTEDQSGTLGACLRCHMHRIGTLG